MSRYEPLRGGQRGSERDAFVDIQFAVATQGPGKEYERFQTVAREPGEIPTRVSIGGIDRLRASHATPIVHSDHQLNAGCHIPHPGDRGHRRIQIAGISDAV